MTHRGIGGSVWAWTALLCSVVVAEDAKQKPVAADHAARMKAGTELFRQQVRPLLAAHCVKCHGGQWTKGDFDLSNRKSLIDSGMVDETAADSHLLLLLRHEEEPHMPKDAPRLPDKAIASIARWIDLGAPYDKPLVAGKRAAGPLQVTEADRQFWSFKPLSSAEVPANDDPWCRTDIDRFVLRALKDQGLSPNGQADQRVLMRRAYFALTGLPPTPAQAEAFMNDEAADAYPRLVDRLLDSPQFGERWARHWMDVARFAESHGYEQDYDRPHAYHYRDFLIRAFNDDLPYDRFVQWQLAGDELAPDNPLAMMATGFLGAGVFPTQLTEAEFETARYDELDDMTTTTGVAFLGLSVGCARCHDHKFDPIPTRDYYQLAATFTSTIRSEVDIDTDPAASGEARETHRQQVAKLRAELNAYEQNIAPGKFQQWLASADRQAPSKWTTLQLSIKSTAGAKWERQSDGSWLAKGAVPAKEVLTITGPGAGPLRLAAPRGAGARFAAPPRPRPGGQRQLRPRRHHDRVDLGRQDRKAAAGRRAGHAPAEHGRAERGCLDRWRSSQRLGRRRRRHRQGPSRGVRPQVARDWRRKADAGRDAGLRASQHEPHDGADSVVDGRRGGDGGRGRTVRPAWRSPGRVEGPQPRRRRRSRVR